MSRAAAGTWVGHTLRWQREGELLVVTLDRAPTNEIGPDTLDDLRRLADHVDAGADGARAVVLHSANPRGFSAGADLRHLQRRLAEAHGLRDRASDTVRSGLQAVSPTLAAFAKRLAPAARRTADQVQLAPLRRFLDTVHDTFDRLDMAPLPTVAAVHGVCFGGGFELALLFDAVVADKTARFAFPELRLGLVPGFGGIPRLEREVGGAVVRDLLFTGRTLRATRAGELGLVSQVVAPGKALDVAQRVARQMAGYDPATFADAKRFAKKLPAARLADEKRTFLRRMRSPVVLDALTRFVESTDVRPYL